MSNSPIDVVGPGSNRQKKITFAKSTRNMRKECPILKEKFQSMREVATSISEKQSTGEQTSQLDLSDN